MPLKFAQPRRTGAVLSLNSAVAEHTGTLACRGMSA